jgi:hypothetical protein
MRDYSDHILMFPFSSFCATVVIFQLDEPWLQVYKDNIFQIVLQARKHIAKNFDIFSPCCQSLNLKFACSIKKAIQETATSVSWSR